MFVGLSIGYNICIIYKSITNSTAIFNDFDDFVKYGKMGNTEDIVSDYAEHIGKDLAEQDIPAPDDVRIFLQRIKNAEKKTTEDNIGIMALE